MVAMHAIIGSLGGALVVAFDGGGVTGELLANVARSAFVSGVRVSLGAGAAVALGGALLVLVLLRLPSRASRHGPDSGPGTGQANRGH